MGDVRARLTCHGRSMQNPADAHLSAHHDDAEMFELAPVSLWLEDYSGLRRQFAAWRDAGVEDLRAHLLDDPRRVKECSALIKVIKVNRATLALFEASSLEHLVAHVLIHEVGHHFGLSDDDMHALEDSVE